jgi:hypothetical protein
MGFREPMVQIILTGKLYPFYGAYTITRHVKLSLFRYRRIKLTDRAGCRIAGIGKQWFFVLLAFSIQLFKFRDINEYFTADINLLGDRLNPFYPDRNGLNGLNILCDIFAFIPVSPGRGPDKNSPQVRQLHGKAVVLGLDSVFHFIV